MLPVCRPSFTRLANQLFTIMKTNYLDRAPDVRHLLEEMKCARSPLLRLSEQLLVKHEGLGSSGSHKGRSAACLFEDRLKKHGLPQAVTDRSSGSWALMLSTISAACGVPSTFVTAGEPDEMVRRGVEANNGRFLVVKSNAERRAALRDIQDQGAWCPDQHNNPEVIGAFRRTLGKETAADLKQAGIAHAQLRFVVAAMGTGGSAAGLALGLRDEGYDQFELIGCDSTTSIVGGPVVSAPFGISVPGVGSSDEVCRTFREARKHLKRPLIRVSPLLAAEAAAEFKRSVLPCGCGMSSGLALAAATHHLIQELRPGEKILILFADDATRYAKQIAMGSL